jgi:predicted DNA-binding transcriptional regulator YafY/glutathione S-transferase
MSRTTRMFDLLQALRRHRMPVSGARLAAELGVSLRTLYRDIAALQGIGAEIDGEPGLGYVMKPGFTLPPLMFSEEEIEALALGLRWVARRADDDHLGSAAGEALAKVSAVLPAELRRKLDDSALLVGPGWKRPQAVELACLRRAIRDEQRLRISYRDEQGRRSERTIWPFALGFFESTRIVAAWCELRQDFRHFRTDRIEAASAGERYPRRRQALLRQWRAMLTETDSTLSYAGRPSAGVTETKMDKELVFYTNPWSRGGIVHWMLEELGVPYRTQVLEYGGSMKSPEYLAINPMGKVPAIRHGEQVVTEAAAICAYLADAFPEAGLAPEPSERGDYYRWLFFGAGPVEAALSMQSCGFVPTAEQQMRIGYGSYQAVVDTLAGALRGKRYIAGDRFSAADVYLGAQIGWGMKFDTLEKRPEFEAYWNGLKDRPAHRRIEEIAEKAAAQQAWAPA